MPTYINVMLVVFGSLFVLKITSILHAISWMIKYGATYRNCCLISKPSKQHDFFMLFDKYHAGFFPFGLKDFKLRRALLNASVWNEGFLGFFQRWFFTFQGLTFFATVFELAGAMIITQLPDSHSKQMCGWLLYSFIFLQVICQLLLMLEALVSYSIMGSYAALFHMQPLKSCLTNSGRNRLAELKFFLKMTALSVLVSANAVFVTHCSFDSFSDPIKEHYISITSSSAVETYFNAIYFTVTTFLTVGYGDFHAFDFPGRLISLLIMAQGALLIIVVFSSLQSARLYDNEEAHINKN